jgi:uncharacterized protein involved in exopolysaccharide biosynthesis
MSNNDDEQKRRERAEELRRQIREIKSEATDESPEMKPGESPKEYIERRQRETAKKNPPDLNE